MPSSIWTQSGAEGKVRPLSAAPWRVVEAQHRIATRKLVDSDYEQHVLESLLETAKPPLRDGERLHYLLATPFRYPPLPHGSRFGTRWEPGIWYGSDALPTAFAEVAYYRLLFLAGTVADLGAVETDLSAFRAQVRTRRGLDLASPFFARWHPLLASKTTYAHTQPFGAAMREAGVDAVRYLSARDDSGGTNVALLTPRAFASRKPRNIETWRSVTTPVAVEFTKRDYFDERQLRLERAQFLVNGRLPQPAVGS